MYLLNIATGVNGEVEDHLVTGNLGSAVLVIQIQILDVVAERVEVTPLDHNVHVV